MKNDAKRKIIESLLLMNEWMNVCVCVFVCCDALNDSVNGVMEAVVVVTLTAAVTEATALAEPTIVNGTEASNNGTSFIAMCFFCVFFIRIAFCYTSIVCAHLTNENRCRCCHRHCHRLRCYRRRHFSTHRSNLTIFSPLFHTNPCKAHYRFWGDRENIPKMCCDFHS